MNGLSEKDVVGLYIKATLVNGTEVKGNIFTYNPKEELLVVLSPPGNATTYGQSSNVKIIRTPYIKEFELIAEEAAPLQLPESISAYEPLPAIGESDKSMLKHVTRKVKVGEEHRRQQLDNLEDAPIAACTYFLKLNRVFPQMEWDQEDSAIRDENLFIVGDPDWTHPVVKPMDGVEMTKEVESSIQRVKAVLEK